ncbi:hypothetical protein TYRP_007266 [Tyrophagus putrescentiae]|nr:hypothetical protein TYRP_007266 [Tyrophagus putrescentiae]
MWPDSRLLGALSLRCLKQCRPTLLQKRCAHYQITSTGEKVVVSKKHNIRSKKEKWQNVSPMGKEPEVTKINLIEKNARLHSDPKQAKLMAESKLTQLRSRLLISGFCRDGKPYSPPSDVSERIDRISKEILGDKNVTLSDHKLKFTEFDHEVPNSDLFLMKTVDDVKQFYQTEVIGKNSYDQMAQNPTGLPKNLHIIPEPIIFNKKADTYFGGGDAYPGPKIDQVGLKARKKYPTNNETFMWPDV